MKPAPDPVALPIMHGMKGLDLEIRLDRGDGICRPGDVIRGEVWVRADRPLACEKLVVRRLWRAHGKGNPEEGHPSIHDLFHGEWAPGPIHRYPFEFTLPNGPATYHGQLLDVGWYIDARAEIPLAIDPRAEMELPLEPGPSEGYFFGPSHAPRAEGPPAGGPPADDEGEGPKAIFGGALAAMGLAGLIAGTVFGFAGWPGAIGGGMLLLLGGRLALPIVLRKVAQRRLGTPKVDVDDAAAHPGGRVGVRVTLSPLVPVTLDGLRIDLVAREEVVHGYDSDRTLNWKEVHRLTASPDRSRRAIESGETVTIDERIPIPANAPLTFAGRENQLEWFVEVTVAVSGWIDWRRRFPVTVGPVAALAAAGILDMSAEPLLQSRS